MVENAVITIKYKTTPNSFNVMKFWNKAIKIMQNRYIEQEMLARNLPILETGTENLNLLR